MKKPSGWIIFFGLITIPTAIYYSIQLWSLSTNKAELRAFVKTEKVELPAVYRTYLRAVDSPDGRKRLTATYDVAVKDHSYYPSDLEALRKFAESVPIFGWGGTDDVITVKIVNVGRKVASGVKVFSLERDLPRSPRTIPPSAALRLSRGSNWETLNHPVNLLLGCGRRAGGLRLQAKFV